MIYMLISFFISLIVFWFIPKRCNTIALYGALLTAISIEVMTEIFLDKRYDLLGFLTTDVDYAEFLIPYGIFPLFYAIFLNIFPFGKSFLRKAGYMMVVILICVLYERGALHFGMLYYHRWKWWYTLMAYPFFLLILTCNYTWLNERIKYDNAR